MQSGRGGKVLTCRLAVRGIAARWHEHSLAIGLAWDACYTNEEIASGGDLPMRTRKGGDCGSRSVSAGSADAACSRLAFELTGAAGSVPLDARPTSSACRSSLSRPMPCTAASRSPEASRRAGPCDPPKFREISGTGICREKARAMHTRSARVLELCHRVNMHPQDSSESPLGS